MLKKVAFVIVGIVALFLIVCLFIDGEYHVKKTVVINKPQGEVYDYVKQLKNQREYSVWELKDPNANHTYTGTDGTVGFVSAWDSDNEDVGKGEQEILAMTATRIDYELRFKEPFEATDKAYMEILPKGEGQTEVIWGFDGEMPYPSNFFMLFMDMEEMLGGDLQQGLDNLKSELE